MSPDENDHGHRQRYCDQGNRDDPQQCVQHGLTRDSGQHLSTHCLVLLGEALDADFQNAYLRQNLNASAGSTGDGGNGEGGANNGKRGAVGADGTVLQDGFKSSQELIEGRLGSSFYQASPPFLFLHPTQCQMLLEKTRLTVLFSTPT